MTEPDWNDCDGDAELAEAKRAKKQEAKEVIADLLKENGGYSGIDTLVTALWTSSLGKSEKNDLARLLESIAMLHDELLALARS